jgi:predicted nucleic acid-binding protein
MKKLLDTTFLIHFLTRESVVKPFLNAYDDPDINFVTSMISMKELAVGVHHVEDNPTISDLQADLGWVNILPFSMRHAFYSGKIQEHFEQQGMNRDRINALGGDILIGGVALAENATVVTQNTDYFELMPEVDVEQY